MLDGVDITHSWYGHVAMNRDMIPRVFSRHGMRYAAGYCGSGVVWARWAGQKAAWQVLGDERGRSALDFRPPPPIPLFNGTPWFLPAVYAWMTLQDRLGRPRTARPRLGSDTRPSGARRLPHCDGNANATFAVLRGTEIRHGRNSASSWP